MYKRCLFPNTEEMPILHHFERRCFVEPLLWFKIYIYIYKYAIYESNEICRFAFMMFALAGPPPPPPTSSLPFPFRLLDARWDDEHGFSLYGLTFFWSRPEKTKAFCADRGSTMFSRSTPFFVLLFDDELVSGGAAGAPVFDADLLALNCNRWSLHSNEKSMLCWLHAFVACMICEAVTLCWLPLPPNMDESKDTSDDTPVEVVGARPEDVLRRTSDLRISYSSMAT